VDTKQPPSDRLALVRMEWQILQLLLIAADDPRRWPLWPLEAVVAETSDPVVAVEALAQLCEVGLLQRRGDSVMSPVQRSAFIIWSATRLERIGRDLLARSLPAGQPAGTIRPIQGASRTTKATMSASQKGRRR
jgi:hypothetical protein